MNIITIQLSNFLDLLIFTVVLMLVFKNKLSKLSFFIPIIVCFFIGIVENKVFSSVGELPWLNLLLFTIMLLFVCVINRNSVKESVVWVLLYGVIAMLSESIAMMILNFSYGATYQEISIYLEYEGIVVTYIMKLMISVVVTAAVLHNSKLYDINVLPRYPFLCVLLIPLISIVWLATILIANSCDYKAILINSLGILIINLLICVLVMILIQVYGDAVKSQLANASLRSDIKNFRKINENLLEIKKIKHDLKNTLLIINGYLLSSEYILASEYIASFLEKVESSDKTRKFSDNWLINYFLSQKYYLAKDKEIDTLFDVRLGNEDYVDEDILSILLANLLDNAIQACERIKTGERFINFHFCEKQDRMVIIVENSFNKKELLLNKFHGTGIGLENVKKLVSERNGVFNKDVSDSIYRISIILFLDERKDSHV